MTDGSASADVTLLPITDNDVSRVSEFLHRELNPKVSAEQWAKGIRVNWSAGVPNHGFMLICRGQVIGANLAFYSARVIDGHELKICNLGAFCVAEGH